MDVQLNVESKGPQCRFLQRGRDALAPDVVSVDAARARRPRPEC